LLRHAAREQDYSVAAPDIYPKFPAGVWSGMQHRYRAIIWAIPRFENSHQEFGIVFGAFWGYSPKSISVASVDYRMDTSQRPSVRWVIILLWNIVCLLTFSRLMFVFTDAKDRPLSEPRALVQARRQGSFLICRPLRSRPLGIRARHAFGIRRNETKNACYSLHTYAYCRWNGLRFRSLLIVPACPNKYRTWVIITYTYLEVGSSILHILNSLPLQPKYRLIWSLPTIFCRHGNRYVSGRMWSIRTANHFLSSQIASWRRMAIEQAKLKVRPERCYFGTMNWVYKPGSIICSGNVLFRRWLINRSNSGDISRSGRSTTRHECTAWRERH
jgi:hypothetical protein